MNAFLAAVFSFEAVNNDRHIMNIPEKNAETRQESGLRIVRQFEVAPDIVFDALTSPEAMRAWWTDDTVFEIDLRVGGSWTITRKEGDMVLEMMGEYLEIEKPNWLKYTIGMPQFSPNRDVVSIRITPHENGGSVVFFDQTGVDIAAELQGLPEGSISESEKGWQQGFDLMAAAWGKGRKGVSAS